MGQADRPRPLVTMGQAVVAAALVLGTVGIGACSALEDEAEGARDRIQQETSTTGGGDTTEVPTTDAPTTEAPTTEVPTTDAPTTEAPETPTGSVPGEDGDDDGTDIDWGLIGLIAAIAVVVLLLIWIISSQLAKRRRAEAAAAHRIGHLVGGAQWVHDQASLEMMSSTQSDERLRAIWGDTRRRIGDLETDAAEIAVSADQDVAAELRHLGQALGGLASALDTNVDLRVHATGDPGSTTAVDESIGIVNQRRHELQQAIGPLRARV